MRAVCIASTVALYTWVHQEITRPAEGCADVSFLLQVAVWQLHFLDDDVTVRSFRFVYGSFHSLLWHADNPEGRHTLRRFSGPASKLGSFVKLSCWQIGSDWEPGSLCACAPKIRTTHQTALGLSRAVSGYRFLPLPQDTIPGLAAKSRRCSPENARPGNLRPNQAASLPASVQGGPWPAEIQHGAEAHCPVRPGTWPAVASLVSDESILE